MSDFKTLLVTTDFSPAALAGVHTAGRLARNLDARVVLLYVVEDRLPPILYGATDLDRDSVLESHCKTAEQSLETYGTEHLQNLTVETCVHVGVPHREILRCARDHGADMIVMATHGYGSVGQLVFGSTAQRVIHHAECPVVTVRSEEED